MKILIVYASKHGTTESCANRLMQALNGIDVTLCNLEHEAPDLSNCDLILAGSSVRFGRLLPSFQIFLRDHSKLLLQKPFGLFLCCGIAHESEYYMEKHFPKLLREAAFQTLYFGGSLQTESLHLWEKLAVRAMRSSILESELEDGEYTPSLPSILPENVERMATYARRELKRLKEIHTSDLSETDTTEQP